jgi:uncharacterized protein GlcG (DUF336 family)
MGTLSLKQANAIIEHALVKAREMKIKPLAVVVLDDSGHVKAAQREDRASMFRFDVAQGKAWAAVGMGASSRALAKRAKDNPNFFITLAATAQGKFLPQIGGVLIRNAEEKFSAPLARAAAREKRTKLAAFTAFTMPV